MNADQNYAIREKMLALKSAQAVVSSTNRIVEAFRSVLIKGFQAPGAEGLGIDELSKIAQSLRHIAVAEAMAMRCRERAEAEYKAAREDNETTIPKATVDRVRAAFLQPGRKAEATDCSKVKQLTGKVRFHAGVNETFVLQVEEEYHPDFVSLPGGELRWRDATASDFDELSVTVTSQRNTPPAKFHSPLFDECMQQLKALSREPGISEEAIARARRDFLGVRPKQTDGAQNG